MDIRTNGPRSIIYHEGSRYRVNRVIIPAEAQTEDGEITTTSIKQCSACGYIHQMVGGQDPDLCQRCDATLGAPIQQLFRLQNVSTKRTHKINSDEEERLRLVYELRTGVRFAEHQGKLSIRTAKVKHNEHEIATLTYGQAATLWRINLGRRRRKEKEQYGFILDTEYGYWAVNQQAKEDDEDDPISERRRRVIPYVEDHKNCLLFEPTDNLTPEEMATLQAALKNAFQVIYQLEDTELAA